MRTLSTNSPAKPLTVETHLTDEEARAVLPRCWGDFAVSLAARDYLSPNQMVWAHKLALEQLQREQQPAPTAPIGTAPLSFSCSRLVEMFRQSTEAGRKYPKMRFGFGPLVVKLALCGERSRNPGWINVTDNGKYPGNAFYGRISPDGQFHAARPASGEVLDFIERLAADPVAVARESGLASGQCSFCGKELTVATQPWGPVCSKIHGLPYDSLTLEAKRATRKPRKTVARA